MLTRLADKHYVNQHGKLYRIIRYGLWGVSAEIEKRGRKFYVVHPNGEAKDFKTLAEAYLYMEELRSHRT